MGVILDLLRRNSRQSSDRVVAIAQRALKRPETLTTEEIKSLAASVVSQAGK